jgi:hypothetical protein
MEVAVVGLWGRRGREGHGRWTDGDRRWQSIGEVSRLISLSGRHNGRDRRKQRNKKIGHAIGLVHRPRKGCPGERTPYTQHYR